MALPKLNVPVYEAVLPSTEKVIKFRPFLVKEEKVLLTAMEDGGQTAMMNAIKNILKNCVQQKLEVDKLPLFDIEYLFLKLRSKSIGEKSFALLSHRSVLLNPALLPLNTLFSILILVAILRLGPKLGTNVFDLSTTDSNIFTPPKPFVYPATVVV